MKTLSNVNMETLKENVKDVEVTGDPGAWVLVCKASSKKERWMKSTKAMNIIGAGCLVQVTTQQGDNIAEAVVFVPKCHVETDENGISKLAQGPPDIYTSLRK